MKILFYVEPLVERENPEWKKGWITHFVQSLADAFRREGCEDSAFGCLAPTALGPVARKVLPAGRIATIDQSEMIPRFGASALEVATGWYRQTLGGSALESMAELVRNRLGNFSPDLCLTFSPAPFLTRAFPSCKILHLEFGMVSRAPFPETVYFDPLGMFQSGCLAKFAQAIKSYSPDDKEARLLEQFRADFCHVLSGKSNPLDAYIGERVQQYESVILLALQFSNFYAYDAHARFHDQYDQLIHTLESVPRHVGVVVCEHPEHPVLTDSTIRYLQSHYPNFIWHNIFREVYSVSYFLMPYVHGVVTVSSSVGFQTLLWKKRLAVVGSSHLDLIADTHEVAQLIPALTSEWDSWKESVAVWLLSHFHLPFQPLCSSGKLIDYLQILQAHHFESLSQSTAQIGMDAAFLTESYKSLAEKKWVGPLAGDGRSYGNPSLFYAALYHATADHPSDETHCVRQFVAFENQEEVTLAFPIPDRGSPPVSLRFDPANKPIDILLTKMWVSDKWGNPVWEWNGSREAFGRSISGMSLFESLDQSGVFLICHMADPQMAIPIAPEILAECDAPITVSVGLKPAEPALLEAAITGLHHHIQTTEQKLLQDAAAQKRHVEERLGNLYSRMLMKESELRQMAAELAMFQEERRELRRQLDGIYSSLMWRIMNRIRRMRDRLCPENSRRGRLYERFLGWVKTSKYPQKTWSSGGMLDRTLQLGKSLLPVSPNQKYHLVSFVFTHFGSMFQGTDSYRRWQEKQPPGLPNHPHFPDFSQEASRAPLHLVQLDQNGVEHMARSLNFSGAEQPIVSVVIPVHNQLEYTLCCLASLDRHESQITYEVILVDDASDDESSRILPLITNMQYVRNEHNMGFLQSCNKGAMAASGKFLVFLNNDTQVLEGWLEELVKTVDEYADVGLVGSKLIYPNGVLQEAGAIIQRDGSAELVGLNADASRPEYNVVREVDYCSGACLLIEAGLFKTLGGFDEIYSPCYCEDSDLAFRVRKMGKRVLYQPHSVVVHHLSVSTNHSKHAKMPLVARNTHTFVQRWSHELKKLNEVRAIAFYLPQYHPIPENDRWWGKGFTEWTNVTKARPNFEGHYQPHLPADLGFYDLRLPEVRDEQAKLARQYGISAFCYYYYWFAGKKLLNRPFEDVLQSGAPDFPFCLCWANENWTRRWDGCEEEILIAQRHTEGDHAAFIQDIAPALADARYLRINGKPLLIVYRLGLIPEPKRTADLWREYCMNEGIGEIYLAYVQSFERLPEGDEPELYGFDAAIEFPPHRYPVRAEHSLPLVNRKYHGVLFDYVHTSENFINRPWPSYKLFRTVMPSWDNTARRQDVSHVFVNANPERYEYWLRQVVEQTRRLHFGDERMVFINAWNEWAEGNHLEPDRQFGHQYLMATKKALGLG